MLKSIESDKREYISSHNCSDYLTKHFNGIYELAVESGTFKSNVSQYCKQTFGDKHGKYCRRLSPHWYASTLEEELGKKTQPYNHRIRSTITTYIKKVLDKKKKKRILEVDESDPILIGTEAT